MELKSKLSVKSRGNNSSGRTVDFVKKKRVFSPQRKFSQSVLTEKNFTQSSERKFANLFGELVHLEDGGAVGDLKKFGTEKTVRFTLNRPIEEIQIGSLVELNKSHKHIGRSVFSSSCNLIRRAADRVTSVDMSEVPVMLDKYNHNTGEEGFVLRPEIMVVSQPIVLHDPASEATKVMKDLLAAHQSGVCGLFIAGKNIDGSEKSEYLISRSINNWITEKPSVEKKNR